MFHHLHHKNKTPLRAFYFYMYSEHMVRIEGWEPFCKTQMLYLIYLLNSIDKK